MIHVIQGPILKEANVFHLVVQVILLILLHFFVRPVWRIAILVLQIRPARPVLRDIGSLAHQFAGLMDIFIVVEHSVAVKEVIGIQRIRAAVFVQVHAEIVQVLPRLVLLARQVSIYKEVFAFLHALLVITQILLL